MPVLKRDAQRPTKRRRPFGERFRRPLVLVLTATALGGTAVALFELAGPRPVRPSGLGTSVGPASQEALEAPPERNCGPPSDVLSEGERIPGRCAFEDLRSGRFVTLAQLQGGKPLVLNFWATWCPFCIREMPDFQRVYAALGGRVQFLGLDLLGVQGETRGVATALARETGVRYPLGFDEGGALYLRISPRVLMPTTAFVRADGTIAFRQFGPIDAARLKELIAEHLGVTAGARG